METKIAREVAEAEFDRFGDMMDLDFDVDTMREKEADVFYNAQRVCVRAIMKGVLEINENGEPVLRPARSPKAPDEITFFEPEGDAYSAGDSKKETQVAAKFFASAARITKLPAKTLMLLKGSDQTVLQTVVSLFLG